MTDKSGDRYGGANSISNELRAQMIAVTITLVAFVHGVRQAMEAIQAGGGSVPEDIFVFQDMVDTTIVPAIPEDETVTLDLSMNYMFALSELAPYVYRTDFILRRMGIHLHGLDMSLAEQFEQALRG